MSEPEDKAKDAFWAGVWRKLGERTGEAILVVLGLVMGGLFLLGGPVLMLSIVCVLLGGLLLRAKSRVSRLRAQDDEAHRDGEREESDPELSDLRSALREARQELRKERSRRRMEVRERDAKLDGFGRTVNELRASDNEKAQRIEALHAALDRRDAHTAMIRDLLTVTIEEADTQGILRLSTPAILLERMLGVAREELSQHRGARVALAVVEEDGASRRVISNAGLSRADLEDTARPLVDLPIDAAESLYPVRLPMPYIDKRLIAVFAGKPTSTDKAFVDLAACIYANILLLVRATSRTHDHA